MPDWERRWAWVNPRADHPKASSNLSEGDLRSYRALLGQNDEFKESVPRLCGSRRSNNGPGEWTRG